MSLAEYQVCALGHHAAESFQDEHGRGMVNVESIGGNLIIQHNRAIWTERSDIEMCSASRVYLLFLIPVSASVRWFITVRPKTASSHDFTCTVRIDLHPALRAMSRLMALGWFFMRHVDKELQVSSRTFPVNIAVGKGAN